MKYVMVAEYGTVQDYDYWANEEDRQNLIRCAQIMKDAHDRGYFPKHKGYLCRSCDWFSACYQTKGWERHYIDRKQDESR